MLAEIYFIAIIVSFTAKIVQEKNKIIALFTEKNMFITPSGYSLNTLIVIIFFLVNLEVKIMTVKNIKSCSGNY
jgi:hypothetical protein